MCRLPLLAAVAAVVAVLGVPEAAAQTKATCPEPITQANFDADSYLGDWYEMKRVPRSFEDDGECGMAQYSWLDSTAKNAVNVLNTNFLPQSMAVSSVVLKAVPEDLPNGKLNVVFPTLPNVPGSKYWVLGTDYKTYAVVYSCSVDPNVIVPHITLWVLARHPATYTAEVDAKVNEIIKTAGLDASILKTVEHHQGCPMATCKACSSPTANLDLSKLKGRWAEVQHSPFSTDSDKQSCSLAQFAATSDGVKFNGTTYQASSETTGTEKPMTLNAKWTDATKKDGSFEISGGGKFCVLGTDYNNWAVVSVCVPPAQTTTTAAPVGPVATPSPAAAGGVYVLSRKRGLTPAQQMEANMAVVNAGIPAASMQTTPATPCPAIALEGDDGTGSSAASAAVTPAVLVASLLAAVLGQLRPAQ